MRSRAHYHLVYRSTDTMVELHWRTDSDFPVERNDASWWQAAPRIAFQGSTVRAFSDSDLFLVVCLHGSKHRWNSLGWLVDVAELLRSPRVDATEVAAGAKRLGAELRLYLGVRLARDLLGAPVPAALAAGCERRDVANLAESIAHDIFAPPASGPWSALRRELQLHPRKLHKVRRIWEVIVPPTMVEWTRWPLPRPLFFLYPFLRLGRLAARQVTRSRQIPAAATPRTPPPQPRSTN
jgi:hypothetical protein